MLRVRRPVVVGEVQGDVVVDLHDQERPKGVGGARPRISAKNVADSRLSLTDTIVWLSWTAIAPPDRLPRPAGLADGQIQRREQRR